RRAVGWRRPAHVLAQVEVGVPLGEPVQFREDSISVALVERPGLEVEGPEPRAPASMPDGQSLGARQQPAAESLSAQAYSHPKAVDHQPAPTRRAVYPAHECAIRATQR